MAASGTKWLLKNPKVFWRASTVIYRAPVNEEVRKKCIGDTPVITGRPADALKPEFDKYIEEIKDYMIQEEDALSYALFPQVAMNFFKKRKEAAQGSLDIKVSVTEI